MIFLKVIVIPFDSKDPAPGSARSRSAGSTSHLSLLLAADLLDVNRIVERNHTEHIIETAQRAVQNKTTYQTQMKWKLRAKECYEKKYIN